jgi:hypothetical protein
MAVPVLGLLFSKDPRTKIIGAPQEISIDAVITRGHSFSASVTRAPVEDGTTINDHVILDPVALTIEGMTSDHPVDLLAGLVSAVGAVGGALGLGGGETRSQTAAKALEEAWRSKAELEIVTRLRTYKNMVIESLEFTESDGGGQALWFRASFVEIRKVSLQRVPSSGLGAIATDLAEGPVEVGRQAPKPAPKPTPAAVTSLSDAAKMAA